MADLRELYQEVIIDHSKSPRNFCKLEHANREAEGFNPLCGDKITLYLEITENTIINSSFTGSGCAISTASASLMTEAIKGKSLKDAEALFEKFHVMLTQGDDKVDLGKLNILAGVKQFPMRVKCATLAWHTMHAALEDQHAPVTTE